MRTDALIVGAGPAGLVLAAVLAAHGVDFQIVDDKPSPVDQSRAALVHVRTLELLDRLGLAEEALARGVQITGVEIYEHGRRAGAFPLGGAETESPFPHPLGLEQDQTERLLVEHLAEQGRAVAWNTTLVGLTSTTEGSTARLRRGSGVDETISARWVIGADGARSRVRHAADVEFTGSTYAQTGLLADVELELPADTSLPAGTLRLNLTRGGFVGLFALRSGRYRLFGALPPGLTVPNRAEDVSHEAYGAAPQADIQRWLTEDVGVDARIRHTAWTALFRIHSRIAERFRAGNTFLVGDAAHIHSPAGGQGMNLAVGDAFNLGWKLALVINGKAHPALLDSYQAERYPVARTVLRGSDRGFALETTSNPIVEWIRANIASRLVGPLTRLRPVRNAIFALFAQTWISYPHSPAVAGGHAGHHAPRPGQRAPNGRFESRNTSVFVVCGGIGQHVLLFEGATPSPGIREQRRAVETLLDRYAVDVSIHDVPASEKALHARYRIRAPHLILIRPDGHIAYTGTPDDLDRLDTYLGRIYTRRR